MLILALDATAKEAAAAVLSDGAVLASASGGARSGSEVLLPLAEAVLSAADKRIDELDLLAVAVGPGSFTGVRIGVALAKGIAFGRELPVAPVSTTEALAENLRPLPGIYCPVMDARRGEVYNALFRADENGALVRLTPDRAISPDALAGELAAEYSGAEICLVGDGVYVAEPHLLAAGLRVARVPDSLARHSAVSVARVGARMAARGETVSVSALAPTYLRRAQADEKPGIATGEK